MTTKAEQKRTAFATFVHLLAGDHDFGQALQDANFLWRMANRLNRLNETDCNVGLTDRQQVQWRDIAIAAHKIADTYGCTIRIDGDPRGYAIHVLFPTPAGNTWGGDESGWGIGDDG